VDAEGIATTFAGCFIVLRKAVFTPEGQPLMGFISGLPHLLAKIPDLFLRLFNKAVSDARSAGWQDLMFSIEQFHEEQQPDEVADYTDLSPAAFLTAIISNPLTKEEQQVERDRMVTLRRTDEMAARQRDRNRVYSEGLPKRLGDTGVTADMQSSMPDIDNIALLTKVEQIALMNALESYDELPREQIRDLVRDSAFTHAARFKLQEYEGTVNAMGQASSRINMFATTTKAAYMQCAMAEP
jgi:hypothetical protein